jgi:NitT/TauT family transport system substrate-binding protein
MSSIRSATCQKVSHRTLKLVTLCLLSLAFAGCRKPANTSGLIPVTLQTDWYPQPEHGGFYTAQLKGYYKNEGLDVTILPGGPYVSTEALIASGKIQFGLQSSDHILDAISNAHEPIIAIGATMQHDPQGILIHENSPVHTWTDLHGRSIAVKPGSTWWAFIVHKFKLYDVHEVPATFSVANFIQDPNYMQQGFLTSEPYFANKGGAPARMLLNRDAGYDPYRVFFTSSDYVKQHPDIVAKFVRASIHGWKDYMQDPAATNALLEKLNPAMSPDWADYTYKTLKSGNFITGDDPSGNHIGQFDPARWQTTAQHLYEIGVIKQPIDPKLGYTTQFLK